jgi:hypothetical protein
MALRIAVGDLASVILVAVHKTFKRVVATQHVALTKAEGPYATLTLGSWHGDAAKAPENCDVYPARGVRR